MKIKKIARNIGKNYFLYLFLLPALVYVFIFLYLPIYGIQIAFRDFSPNMGILGSPWAGLKYFERFITSYQFWTLLRNTLSLSVYSLAAGFPVPILLALMLNYTLNPRFKKFAQSITYAPHFISVVVMTGMLMVFLSPRTGIVNQLIKALGLEPISFLGKPEMFSSIYVWSGIWQNAGWGSIIYIAALTGINPELHEAAMVDGASKLQRIMHIDIPGILPTAVILLILSLGQIMSVGFEKAYLMQNALNIEKSEIISTYVYKIGMLDAHYSYSSAIGLFNNAINFILLVVVNRIARQVTGTSLW